MIHTQRGHELNFYLGLGLRLRCVSRAHWFLGRILGGVLMYADDTIHNYGNIRSWCGHCKKDDTPEGHDGCLGTLDESLVMNACCGHDDPSSAYIQFWDGTCIQADEANAFIQKQKVKI